MKKNLFLMLICLLLFIFKSNAQKLAYVDADAIIIEMPEYKRVRAEVEVYREQLQKQLEAEQQKMQNYYTEIMYRAQSGELTLIEQKTEEEKLAKMQEDLQRKSAKYEKDLTKREQDLIKPIYEKFNNALDLVAEENGYSYMMDKKQFLYLKRGIDATSKVKAKLGLQ